MATLSEFNTILTKLQNPTRTSAEDKELSNMMNGVEFGLSFANDEKNLKNLNFSKGSSDIYVNHINNLSKNYDYNNNNVLNLTEKKYNNLNISSFSTYNKFYTEFNNKYSKLLTEINIQNNNLESLTQFVYNNRNNITNINLITLKLMIVV